MQDARNEHGEGQMPGVTHGDEHHVAVVTEVPLRTVRGVKHETDLSWEEGGEQGKGVTKLESIRGRCSEFSKVSAFSYLPEPGPLQDGEGAAQQLQQDVATMENLKEGDQRAAKDRVQKQLVHKDVQHGPPVQVVQEEETWESTHKN